jgi:hypothetical protein
MIDQKNKKPKLTDAERHKRFVETAKKVEASENIEDFDKAFDCIDVKLSARRSRRNATPNSL